MSKLFVDEIVHQSSQGSGTITLGASGEKVNLGTGVSGGTLTNTPAFEAYMSSIQESVANTTYTKAQIDTEVFDTDNCYDNSTNYRFTPTVAGKYFVYSFISFFATANDVIVYANTAIYKNGTRITSPRSNYGGGSANAHAPTQWVYSVLDLNGSTDYVEIYGQANCSTGNIRFLSNNHTQSTRFGAYRLIGA